MKANAITKNLISRFRNIDQNLIGLDIIVSFIKSSGLNELQPIINHALVNNIPIRIITSTYMNITEPVALSKLLQLLGEGPIHLYNGNSDSFHPKAYFFKYKNSKNSHIYLGSSNISKAAMTTGIEWNYRILEESDSLAFYDFVAEFEEIFEHQSYVLTENHIKSYREDFIVSESERKNTKINSHYNKFRKQSLLAKAPVVSMHQPKEAQAEALFELDKTRQQGNDKALVVVATGVGKTYLAAFDSMGFGSVLFIAHREEILKQAAITFGNIRGSEEIGFYNQRHKDTSKKVLFGSVQTLSRKEHLSQFKPNQFEYIVIDEFHHASSVSYRRIVEYFKPKFMLGLTATPHRLDKKDIFEICDYNVPYEASLFHAINRDWLVPFHYYGIYDNTVQYENITFLHGKYIEKELTKELSVEDRADLIYRHYMKHQRENTIGFCSSIDHAEYMADYFNSKGIRAVTMHSDSSREYVRERGNGLEEFKQDKIQVIFSVDMLNEGVDLPDLDLILFLRPTESPTVFLQQLGRGLRHSPRKENLKVLDFIGNYRNVELLPLWLSGEVADTYKEKKGQIKRLIEQEDLPVGCFIDFELEVIDLFTKILSSKIKLQELIDDLYEICKVDLGHIPSRMEFFESLDEINYRNIKKTSRLNPFRDFVSYINNKEKNYVSNEFLKSDAYKFIQMIETTGMQALYKIPIFLAFYNNGDFTTQVNQIQIQSSFYHFYQNRKHWRDLERYKTRSDFKTWKPKDYWTLAFNNPIHFLLKTHGDIFEYDNEKMLLKIKLDLNGWDRDDFFLSQVKDVIEFRRNQFLDKNLNSL